MSAGQEENSFKIDMEKEMRKKSLFSKTVKVFKKHGFFRGAGVFLWKTYGHFHKGWKYRYAQLMAHNYIGYKKGWETDRDRLCEVLAEYHPDLWKKKPRRLHIADYFLCEVFLGAHYYDYFNHDLFRHGWLYRRKSMGSARVVIASRELNTPAGKQICDDKVQTATLWEAWFRRKWLLLSGDSEITAEELKGLLNSTQRVIAKPLSGACGKGVFTVEVTNEDELTDAVKNLNQLESPHIIEEYIDQKGLLHEFNPSSINTVRVITARYPDGVIQVMNSFIRVGHAGSVTDNVSSGGMEFRVRTTTGEIGQGKDHVGNTYSAHPENGYKITGLSIPRWNEVLDFCFSAHRIAPKGLNWIGWDVCVSEDGLYLIEANACPGMSAFFKGEENRWKKVCALLDAYDKKRVRMSIFERINRKMFPTFFKERKDLIRSISKQKAELNSLKEQTSMARTELTSLRNELADIRKETQRELNTLRQSLKHQERIQLEYMDPALYPHALKQWYQHTSGDILDLDNPRTYNEKIQWMKVYDPDPRKTLLADKYLVRDWVAGKIGEQYLTPLLGVYRKSSDIDFDSLPNQFVLKANHGFHMNAIVRDKSSENLDALRRTADSWLRDDFAFNSFEMHYNDIPRRLIIEEYLENLDGDLPDYKFWCFDGKVRFIELIMNRNHDPHMALLDSNWNLLPFTTGSFPEIISLPDKPEQLSEMICISEVLSDGFPHVRVDLYLLDTGKIRFGEMTFTTSSGMLKWNPPEADLWVGEMLHLPDWKYTSTKTTKSRV